MLAFACPSIRCTAFTLAPALTARLAAVCRRSCGVIDGNDSSDLWYLRTAGRGRTASRPQVGQPVALTFANCGRCASNDPAYCERSTDLNMRGDGGDEASAFSRDGSRSSAAYSANQASRRMPLPAKVIRWRYRSDRPALAAPLGCSVQTGIGTLLNVLAPQRDDAVVTRGPMPKPRVSQTTVRCATRAAPHSLPPRVRGMMVEPSEVTDMDLYLMQHGQATTETEDPERPLTDAGRAAVQRVAQRARAADVRISGCLHSGKLRAEQTAQLLVAEIGVEPSVEARAGLAPNDPVVPVAQWLRAETEHQSLALVGHMPFLGRLASLLVAGDEQAQVVGFQMGGLLKLEPKVDRDGFLVAWALPPALA